MRIAVLSESRADDALMRRLLSAVLGEDVEFHEPRLARRHGGFDAVVKHLTSVVGQLYHGWTHIDALVVTADSDDTQPHLPSHESDRASVGNCRYCLLNRLINDHVTKFSGESTRPPLKWAVGLAMPCIEAWLLYGMDAQCTEAAWLEMRQRMPSRLADYRKALKRKLYSTDRPIDPQHGTIADQRAEAIASNLDSFTRSFPNGFGPMLHAVRSWRSA